MPLASAALLAAVALVVPPVGEPKVTSSGPEVAVFASVNGQVQRLDPGDRGGPGSPYPERAQRLSLQGDITLLCDTSVPCRVIAADADPVLSRAALALGYALAPILGQRPLTITFSFRILSEAPPTETLWAPSPCPNPGSSQAENARLSAAYKQTGRCLPAPAR